MQVFILDPFRGHENWPTYLEESRFLLVADYMQAQRALLKAADSRSGEQERAWTLKFNVAEALNHPLGAPSDGMLYFVDYIFFHI